jgi:hypothetical protein
MALTTDLLPRQILKDGLGSVELFLEPSTTRRMTETSVIFGCLRRTGLIVSLLACKIDPIRAESPPFNQLHQAVADPSSRDVLGLHLARQVFLGTGPPGAKQIASQRQR